MHQAIQARILDNGIPKKIKVFIQRTAKNLLLTADNLWKREVM